MMIKNKLIIYIGADHAGFNFKKKLIVYLNSLKYKVFDVGGNSATAPDDYPDFAYKVAKNVSNKKNHIGILLCGSGVGVCITANKVKGIRAALVYNPNIADLAVRHDAANILCLGARVTSFTKIKKIVDIFLNSKFEKGRHLRRINKIINIEQNEFK